MVWLAWNEKQTYQLDARPQIWLSILIFAMTLIWNFKVKYYFPKSHKEMGWLPWNKKKKKTNLSNYARPQARPQIWPYILTLAMTLTLHFQCQISNLLYCWKIGSNCQKAKKCTFWLNTRPQMLLWVFTWVMALTFSRSCHLRCWCTINLSGWPL